ncbi:MAG: hypothetical protein Q8K70_00030 [Bacteroidota bacterium]|nr:hypothetical protein [Bacteroidota bacterium]
MKGIFIFIIPFTFTSCLNKKINNKYYNIENIILYRCCDDLRAISIIKEELIFEVKSNDSNINKNSKLLIKVNIKNCRPLVLEGNWDNMDSVFCSYKNTVSKNDTFIHQFKIDLNILGVSLKSIIDNYQCIWSENNQIYILTDKKNQIKCKSNNIIVTYLYNDKVLIEKDSAMINRPFMPDYIPDDFFD